MVYIVPKYFVPNITDIFEAILPQTHPKLEVITV